MENNDNAEQPQLAWPTFDCPSLAPASNDNARTTQLTSTACPDHQGGGRLPQPDQRGGARRHRVVALCRWRRFAARQRHQGSRPRGARPGPAFQWRDRRRPPELFAVSPSTTPPAAPVASASIPAPHVRIQLHVAQLGLPRNDSRLVGDGVASAATGGSRSRALKEARTSRRLR